MVAAISAPGPADLAATGLTDPNTLAKLLAQSGIIPPALGVQPAGAAPGMQYSGGVSGAQQAPTPHPLSGAESGAAHLLNNFLPAPGQMPARTLGSLLRGA